MNKARAKTLKTQVDELTIEKKTFDESARNAEEKTIMLKADFEEIKTKLESVNAEIRKLYKELEEFQKAYSMCDSDLMSATVKIFELEMQLASIESLI